MRISFLCHEYPPFGCGASTALFYLTKALIKRGHSIQVVTAGEGRRDRVDRDADGRLIVKLGAGRRKVIAPSAAELLRSYLALRFRSAKYIAEFDPQAITAFFAFPAGRAAIAVGKHLSLPVAVSLRGSDVPGFSNRRWGFMQFLQPFLIRKVWRENDLLQANGNNLVELARQFDPSTEVL